MAGSILVSIPQIIAAAAGLGTAAFGIVETMKSLSTVIGLAGFKHIETLLGPLLEKSVKVAYGDGYQDMVHAQYKSDHRELRRTLRQGVRVGLTIENAKELAEFVGVIEKHEINSFISAANKAILREPSTADTNVKSQSNQLTDQERILLARYELAVDGRIEAALSVAQTSYACTARVWAMVFSIVIAQVVGFVISPENNGWNYAFNALISRP